MNFENNRTLEQPTPQLPEPIGAPASPLWPRHVADLFFRPACFFSSQLALGKTPYLVLVSWCYGVASSIERIDQELLRAELGRPRPGWTTIGPYVTESWLGFWVFILVFGALGGLFLWWLGGWWYRVRLGWCDAPDPDSRMARLTYIYSSFVYSAPSILLTAVYSLTFPNYQAAYDSEEIYSLALIAFAFWSIWVSYRGVTTLFSVSIRKARLWFLVLPALTWSLAIIGIIIVLILAFTAIPADVENPKLFSTDSLTFSYPGNWDLSPDWTETLAVVEAPQDALSRIEVYELADEDWEPLIRASAEYYQGEIFQSCDAGEPVDQLGPLQGVGLQFSCQAQGEPYQLRVFAAPMNDRVVEINEIWPDPDLEKVSPGFDLIHRTLKLK